MLAGQTQLGELRSPRPELESSTVGAALVAALHQEPTPQSNKCMGSPCGFPFLIQLTANPAIINPGSAMM